MVARDELVHPWCHNRNNRKGIGGSSPCGIVLQCPTALEYHAVDEYVRETASRWNQGLSPLVDSPSMRPLNVFPPRSLGCTFFEVVPDCVEHTITAVRHVSRLTWDTDTPDQPAWMRAMHIVCTLADTGIDPVMQQMDVYSHLLMATPGPWEGACLGQPVTAAQVREARKNRYVHTDVRGAIAIDAMVDFLNLKDGTWLDLSMWGVTQSDIGASALVGEENNRGISNGHVHFADADMQFIGRITPNKGFSQLF